MSIFRVICLLDEFSRSVYIRVFFRKSVKNNGHFTWRRTYIYSNISLNSYENEKCFRRKLWIKSKHILCSITFFENRAVYEIMWKKCCRAREAIDENIIRPMLFICWMTKTTNTHSEYVILIAYSQQYVILIAYSRQQWLRERASMLRYTYISCLFILLFIPCIHGDWFIIITQPMHSPCIYTIMLH